MKLTLNLLPEERKKEINNKKIFGMAVKQSLLFLLPIICLVSVLIVLNAVLNWNFEIQNKSFDDQQNQEQYKKLKEYESNFSRINSKLGILLKIETNHFHWSKAIRELSGLVPGDVYLSGLVNKDFQISISGKAKTRDDFLKFKDRISQSECFFNINTPLSNLVEKNDVDFQIDFEVKEECLKNKL